MIKIPEIYIPYLYDDKPYQIWKGSRFSGKSWTKALFFLIRCISDNYFRLVFARDTQKNVRLSQYQLFIDISKKYDLYQYFYWQNTAMKITCKLNDNFMVGGSFEMPDTLRSTADVTDFWAEEPITRQFVMGKESFYDIVGSLRNSHGIPSRFHFTFNPIDKNNFIYKDFFDEETKIYKDEEVTILTANWYDNPFCPESAKRFIEKLRVTNPARYEVDGLGMWGVSQNESPYFYAFDDNKHIETKSIKYNASLPLYLSFDFNIDPITCIVAQMMQGSFCHILKSYKIRNCTLIELCKRIKSDYPNAVYIVTADPAGGARSAGYASVDTTMHNIIRTQLGISHSQMMRPQINYAGGTGWTDIRITCNTILQNHKSFKINQNECADLINDIRKATTDGDSDKLYKTQGNTEYGMHLTDCFIYLIMTHFVKYVKKTTII